MNDPNQTIPPNILIKQNIDGSSFVASIPSTVAAQALAV
jgi:hypothetical protein